MNADQLDLDLEILPDETHERVTKTRNFALAKYSENMSVMQNRLYTQAIAQVSAHDNPEVNQDYNVDIRKMAAVISMRPDNLKKGMKTAARTLLDVAPTVYFENEDGWGTFSIFESIKAPKDSPYVYKIRFTQTMRRIMIEMRKKYEIIYSPDTVMHFKNKYTSKLYDFLLAQMTCLKPNGADFSIETTPEKLMEALQYETESKRIGSFNRDALIPACNDINDFSEIYIQGGQPKPKRLRRAIISYTFTVNYKPGMEIPLVAINNLEEGQCFHRIEDVPNDDFLREVMEDMGVAPSFIKYVMDRDLPMRTWRNILYTKINGNNSPRYFNKAYQEDYARGADDLKAMILKVKEKDPEFRDPVTLGVLDKNARMKNMRKEPVKIVEKTAPLEEEAEKKAPLPPRTVEQLSLLYQKLEAPDKQQ